TVNSLITHTPRWTLQAMGYEGVWGLRMVLKKGPKKSGKIGKNQKKISMGYGILGSMGYGFEFPAYQLGGSKILWVMGEYGLSELWVMRESTV
ncbi:hypothetical protein L208DRAFT_1061442, partial [Tricholoma matsutake]